MVTEGVHHRVATRAPRRLDEKGHAFAARNTGGGRAANREWDGICWSQAPACGCIIRRSWARRAASKFRRTLCRDPSSSASDNFCCGIGAHVDSGIWSLSDNSELIALMARKMSEDGDSRSRRGDQVLVKVCDTVILERHTQQPRDAMWSANLSHRGGLPAYTAAR